MRVRALALLAVLAGAFACEDRVTPGPGRGPSFDELDATPTPPPTPFPLREGEYALTLTGTSGLCGLAVPPETVYLAGSRRAFQIATQPALIDVEGAWDGTNLAMTGGSRRVYRPTLDCIVEEAASWKLARDADSALTGTFSVSRRVAEGEGCADAAEGVLLPCRGTRAARLAFASARRAPKTEAFVPDNSVAPLRIEKFNPEPFDPIAEPTSAPDILRRDATPTPVATAPPTPEPRAKATPKPKAKPKKKSR